MIFTDLRYYFTFRSNESPTNIFPHAFPHQMCEKIFRQVCSYSETWKWGRRNISLVLVYRDCRRDGNQKKKKKKRLNLNPDISQALKKGKAQLSNAWRWVKRDYGKGLLLGNIASSCRILTSRESWLWPLRFCRKKGLVSRYFWGEKKQLILKFTKNK